MPSFSACSSRNDPVPAAQASFMAKSTTTPFSMEMNLESWPPISKIVSTGSPPSVLADVDRAGLVGGDLVVDHVGAHEFGDQLAARSGGAHAANFQAAAPHSLNFGQPLLDRFNGPAGRAQVDVMDHARRIRPSPRRSWKRSRYRGPGRPGSGRRREAERKLGPGRATAPRSPSRAERCPATDSSVSCWFRAGGFRRIDRLRGSSASRMAVPMAPHQA